MYKALVLVRNLKCTASVEDETFPTIERLNFGEFTIGTVGHRCTDLREIFGSQDVNQTDWLLEKVYSTLPPAPIHSPADVGGIPNDIEDLHLLLRLYKPGDIAFVKQAIIEPTGEKLVQYPYRAMNSLNSNSAIMFELGQNESGSWNTFAKGIRESQSWNADWFAVARRFFLYGGAKEFNPMWYEIDRIVDYITAIEATAVPEHDSLTSRMCRRAALLVSPNDAVEQQTVTKLFKQLYKIRSTIVHGSRLSDATQKWLIDNCAPIELRVRQVLIAAIQKLPADEQARGTMLAGMFDPTDEARGNSALDSFHKIKTQEVRKAIAAEITKLAEK